MRKWFIFLCFVFGVYCTQIPDFSRLHMSKDVTFLLTTPRSGSNWVSASLSAITRKPISWVEWGKEIFHPSSALRNHPAYNRLKLDLVSDIPLLYRTHFDFVSLRKVPSKYNRLIFVTRNPKELVYRSFYQTAERSLNPDPEFIREFLGSYLAAFEMFLEWDPANRRIVFYEDFILNNDSILLDLLNFMGEKPEFLEDYLANKGEYISQMFGSYVQQHVRSMGGASSVGGPKAIYYTKNANPETLVYIDDYLKNTLPEAWNQYLIRFKTTPNL